MPTSRPAGARNSSGKGHSPASVPVANRTKRDSGSSLNNKKSPSAATQAGDNGIHHQRFVSGAGSSRIPRLNEIKPVKPVRTFAVTSKVSTYSSMPAARVAKPASGSSGAPMRTVSAAVPKAQQPELQPLAMAPRFTFQSSLGRPAVATSSSGPAARRPAPGSSVGGVRQTTASSLRTAVAERKANNAGGFRQDPSSLNAILSSTRTGELDSRTDRSERGFEGRPTTLLGGASRRLTKNPAASQQNVLPPPTTVRRLNAEMKRASIYSGPVRLPKKPVGLFSSQGSSQEMLNSSLASESSSSQALSASQATFSSSQSSFVGSQSIFPAGSQGMPSSQPLPVAEKPKPMAKLNKAIDDFVARKGPRTPGRGILDPETPREKQTNKARRIGEMVLELELQGTGRKLWGEDILQTSTTDERSASRGDLPPAPTASVSETSSAPAPLEPRHTRSLRSRHEPLATAPLEPRMTRSRKKDVAPIAEAPVGDKENAGPQRDQVVGIVEAPAAIKEKDNEREVIRKRLEELQRMEEELEREVRAMLDRSKESAAEAVDV